MAETRRTSQRASIRQPERAQRASRLTAQPATFVTPGVVGVAPPRESRSDPYAPTAPVVPTQPYPARTGSLGGAMALPGLPMQMSAWTSSAPYAAPSVDPDVWLIALPTAAGGTRPLEGAGRAGAIRVGRPYGHLRSIRPVALSELFAPGTGIPSGTLPAMTVSSTPTPRPRRARSATKPMEASENTSSLGSASTLPAQRPMPAVIAAVEVETDAGVFRVERRDSILSHSDLAWALAHMESGEPDSVVPLPRRQLALLLTLLPTPENPEHPELDPTWGWAHKLRGPWERGPLHLRGRLGRLIAFDPDETARGMHRACFELLGSEEVVWAVGVPCFRTGSVYELTPLGKGLTPSRWLTWPLSKGRKRAGAPERPTWEISRVVYRVGAPRWPLAGVVEPLGPMGVAG